jgi:hypothetical protein
LLFPIVYYFLVFQISDPELIESVLVSIRRHLWYLSEEFVSLFLYDHDTTDVEKATIVTTMLGDGQPQHFPPQKTVMKKRLINNRMRGEVELHEFAGERSWLIFERLDVEADRMQFPLQNWMRSSAFVWFKNLVDSLEVVNDCAERAIKDVTEFVNYSKDAVRCDRIQMDVNHHRQLLEFSHLTKQQRNTMDNCI